MYVTTLHYISELKQLIVDFWLYTGHEQRSPEWKCRAYLSWPPIPDPTTDFSPFTLPHLLPLQL